MDFTNNELKTIEEMGKLCISPREIAINLKVNINNFVEEIADENSEAHKSLYKGFLAIKIQLRRNIFTQDIDVDFMKEQKALVDNFEAQIIKDLNS